MGVIQKIIDQLSDTNIPLTAPLTATKVLATRIGSQELMNWINNEIQGYNNIDDLPSYRIYDGIIEGNFVNGSYKYTNHVIPTMGLQEWILKYVQKQYFMEGVEALETLVANDPEGNLIYPFPAEVVGLIETNFRKIGRENRFLNLLSARRKVSKHVIKVILSNVRNKLLDFMLKIEVEFGDTADIPELKAHKQQVTVIMNQTINTTGDGNIINTGDNANINATINISKGSKSDLLRYLDSIDVEKEDAIELTDVIDNDDQNDSNQSYGQKVSGWIGKMMTKAASGAWSAGISAAGNLLATGIKAYYGWQ